MESKDCIHLGDLNVLEAVLNRSPKGIQTDLSLIAYLSQYLTPEFRLSALPLLLQSLHRLARSLVLLVLFLVQHLVQLLDPFLVPRL